MKLLPTFVVSARFLTTLVVVLGCTAAAQDQAAEKSAPVKKPRTYDRLLNLHQAGTPKMEQPQAKTRDRERAFPDLDSIREPSSFMLPTMPAPFIPPPRINNEPHSKKNWILPPMSDDLKDNRYSFSKKDGEEDELDWGWLEQSIRERRDMALKDEKDREDGDENPLDELDPAHGWELDTQDEKATGLMTTMPENRPLALSPENSLLLLEPMERSGSDSDAEASGLSARNISRTGDALRPETSDTMLSENEPTALQTHQPLGSGSSMATDSMRSKVTSTETGADISLGKLNERIRSSYGSGVSIVGPSSTGRASPQGMKSAMSDLVVPGRSPGLPSPQTGFSTPRDFGSASSLFSSRPGGGVGTGNSRGFSSPSSPGSAGGGLGGSSKMGGLSGSFNNTRSTSFSPVGSFNSKPSLSTKREMDFWDR